MKNENERKMKEGNKDGDWRIKMKKENEKKM